jgi:hypothetical protein
VVGGGGLDRYEFLDTVDGADRITGNGGGDIASYALRRNPVKATLGSLTAGNGEAGENDTLDRVGGVEGGSAADTLSGVLSRLTSTRSLNGTVTVLGSAVKLSGNSGDDTLLGTGFADTLTGGPGIDTVTANAGNDRVNVKDREADKVDCGPDSDIIDGDTADAAVGCELPLAALQPEERIVVGKLRLAPARMRAEAGTAERLQLAWTHPRRWQELRDVKLRFLSDDLAIGEIAIDPHRKRIRARGAARIDRRKTSIRRVGKTLTVRLAVVFDDAVAGRALTAEVHALDVRGRAQVEPEAARIAVR